MQHVLTPYSSAIEPFAWWDDAFTMQELDWLQGQAIRAEHQATVGGNPDSEQLNRIRRSQVSWLNKTPDTAWVFEKLAHVVSSLNAQFFRFDLTGFGEALQLTNYDQSDHGMYGWHQDYGGNASRKLSIVLQLTDPSRYEGGNLQIMTSTDPITIQKKRGFIAAFPSYQLHQVTPVVRGSRQSLVAWVSGPQFK